MTNQSLKWRSHHQNHVVENEHGDTTCGHVITGDETKCVCEYPLTLDYYKMQFCTLQKKMVSLKCVLTSDHSNGNSR